MDTRVVTTLVTLVMNVVTTVVMTVVTTVVSPRECRLVILRVDAARGNGGGGERRGGREGGRRADWARGRARAPALTSGRGGSLFPFDTGR